MGHPGGRDGERVLISFVRHERAEPGLSGGPTGSQMFVSSFKGTSCVSELSCYGVDSRGRSEATTAGGAKPLSAWWRWMDKGFLPQVRFGLTF